MDVVQSHRLHMPAGEWSWDEALEHHGHAIDEAGRELKVVAAGAAYGSEARSMG